MSWFDAMECCYYNKVTKAKTRWPPKYSLLSLSTQQITPKYFPGLPCWTTERWWAGQDWGIYPGPYIHHPSSSMYPGLLPIRENPLPPSSMNESDPIFPPNPSHPKSSISPGCRRRNPWSFCLVAGRQRHAPGGRLELAKVIFLNQCRQLKYMQRQRQPHLAKNFLNVPSLPSGQPFGYTNWIEGEPNDSNGLEDCIAIDRSVEEGSWKAFKRRMKHFFYTGSQAIWCILIILSPKNYQWMDLNCTDPIHGAVCFFVFILVYTYILTPRIRYSYCSSCCSVTKNPG